MGRTGVDQRRGQNLTQVAATVAAEAAARDVAISTAIATEVTARNAAIAAAIGGGQFDIVEPFPGLLANTFAAIAAQSVYAFAVRVAKPITIAKLSIYTNATGMNVDFAILDVAYAKLVGITTPVASVANALTTGTLTTPFPFVPATTYFLAFLSDNATPTVRGFGSGVAPLANPSASLKRAVSKAVAQNTIPNSFLTPTDLAGGAYAIMGHN